MVVLPRMSRMTTSRAFLSAAAAAMMSASSVDVIRFALCIVPILAVHAFRGDERRNHVGNQSPERAAGGDPFTDLRSADVGGVDADQRGPRVRVAEARDLAGVERRRPGPVDDHEVL